MKFKAVPFTAKIKRNHTSSTVAVQVQAIIDQYTVEGWEYLRMESVVTSVAGTDGCFGIGAEPRFTTSYQILIFRKNVLN